ncbi:hypothetical protein BEP19_04395 [Ammoniphilus oxalaticus]|uniref:histidine kinase n=1 Tax=Ammoniphilus oxalaticus TaxID=66863 RepID=A0A419SLW7_9BACL|nr:ATP-binding protein [Ammoniphilus oxalaticus]RKD25067.1 hypothetical protein BEP19_04395 [Ammoniphilus oxalaticus]
MDGLSELLINILIIVSSILVYFHFSSDEKYARLRFAVLATMTILLCMSFPFSFIAGYKYDLRTIPLVIGILYGGWQTSALVCLVMFLYRFYLGGPGFLLTVYSFPAVILLAFVFKGHFNQGGRLLKIMLASGFAFLWAFICSMISFFGSNPLPFTLENTLFYAGFCLLHVLAMWIAIFLIESLDEVRTMRQEMQRAETLNALSELAASVAHEIRNPMTVVRGFMQLLNERHKDETERKYLKMMIGELDHAESIINNFLSLSKPQTEIMEHIDAAEQITHVVSVISSYATLNGVEIKLSMDDAPLSIKANQAKLGQVLLNLIKNGIEAMPDGGTIEIIGSVQDSHVWIEVVDQGIGMTEKELSRLGSPFYSTKKQGTGIGLLTSYRIIHMMKGNIQVYSEKGKGTQFIVQLPLFSRQAQKESAAHC